MRFEIQTREIPIVLELKRVNPPKGIILHVLPITLDRSKGTEEIATFFLEVAKDISVGLVVAWLYDKFKNGKSHTITINRKEIMIEKETITEIIEETVRKEI